MDKSALKKYAPQARKDFIAAVTRRAETFDLNPNHPGTVERDGDALLINGQPFPAELKQQRDTLQQRIADQDFDTVMEAVAYTWFNRLVAIRYMELHDFLGHGYRVLSHPQGHSQSAQPEILDHITEIELDGLDRQRALDLKLAGDRDEDLYREVLLAQCHALHTAMPFLFENLDDATELLLPDGLLRTDSLIRELVTAIDEENWQEVEIIGWLYQFYISEKKDQVIGKVVKSEDIPAATQLFTPNWIVKYLVQNSLGRLWLMANPTSTLASAWNYYIQPAEQTPEVNAQLDELTQTRITEDGNTLNPESLTLLDPACGSGHILVEAYDLLRDIYLERGYRRRDIPRLILEKNLYGLEIDDRAAQLAGFSLLMKARADDRRLFRSPLQINVCVLQQPPGAADELLTNLRESPVDAKTIHKLVDTFAQAKTFGSLIQISHDLARALPELRHQLEAMKADGGLFERETAEALLPLARLGEVLARQYDAVVANPPYMGSRGMNANLKAWAKKQFPASKSDLFAMFIERGFGWCKASGFNSMVTMQSWMFLSSYEPMRTQLLEARTISTMAHLGARAFSEISGEVVQTTAFALQPRHVTGFRPVFFRLVDANEPAKAEALRSNQNRFDDTAQDDFKKIPGSPVAYWVSHNLRNVYSQSVPLINKLQTRLGMSTADNDRFLRYWHEVDFNRVSFSLPPDEIGEPKVKWIPYQKGGSFRKWFGNNEYIVDWSDNGAAIKNNKAPNGRVRSHNYNGPFALKPGITWSDVTSGPNGFRYMPIGFLFDGRGSAGFTEDPNDIEPLLALLNSKVSYASIASINPTIALNVGEVGRIPLHDIFDDIKKKLASDAREAIDLARADWNNREDSWDFESPMCLKTTKGGRYAQNWAERVIGLQNDRKESLKKIEERIEATIISAYGLQDEIDPTIDPKHLSITVYAEEELGEKLISYAIGCAQGRYSLDTSGLIYAHAGNEGFAPSQYKTFPADADGIIPITDEAWFDDDATHRIREFVLVVWGKDTEAENMTWLAESLGAKSGESPDDTIRRYLSKQFFKDHLKTYKKRPIYWLFSSGKQKAFEALVYLHRYNAGTLSRMRMEYVVPLQSKMQTRIESLDQDMDTAGSSAETKRLQKQRDKLAKQLDELRHFDEELRHYADQRIPLDLDDGVKVNYGKFGTLLAEVKAVTGKKPT